MKALIYGLVALVLVAIVVVVYLVSLGLQLAGFAHQFDHVPRPRHRESRR